MRRIACGVICFYVVIFSTMNLVSAAALTDEEKQAFAWFDGLGYPSLKGLSWVRVASGQWSQTGNEPQKNRYYNAFLLKADGDHFSVFTTNGQTLNFVKTGDKTPEYQRVGYEPRNLEEDGRACLEALRHPQMSESDKVWARFGEVLSEGSEIFIFARGCAANGLDDLAHDLCVQAEAIPDRQNNGKSLPFTKRLSNDFAYSTIWQAFLDFEDPKISREQLLATFQAFVTHFPDSEYAARAKETADILVKMVQEDKAHAQATTRPFDAKPVKDLVAELIFQLRDQNGHQWSQPGECDIFMDERGDKSPASQLVAMGFDAVPQLIDALQDDRFTRSVGYHRNFYFSHYVLRVGDCAQTILSRIANHPFYTRRSTSGAMLKDGQADDTKRQVEQWWADVQKKGEKQVLVEAVASGDENATEQAVRLVGKYPEAALRAIVDGVTHAKSDWVRVEFVQAARELKGDVPVVFLTEQLAKGASIDVRVAAAIGLRDRGKTQATAAMIDEWNKQCDAAVGREIEAPGSLIGFLISSDDPAAIQAVKKRILVWPVSTRLSIAEALGESQTMITMGSGSAPSMSVGGSEHPKAAMIEAIQDLLIAQLHDTEELGGMTGSFGDDSFMNPRVCDMAAYSLATRWPKLYSFKFSSPPAARDHQRVVIENIWRKRHNLAALPEPEPHKIPPISQDQMVPLLKLMESPQEETRKKGVDEIEALGLGALPAVRQAAKSAKDDLHKAALEALARRLSCRIEQVDVLPLDFKPEGDFKTALDGLKGKALTSESFIAVLTAFARKQPPEIRGIKLFATREDDLTGIIIRVEMISGNPRRNDDLDIQQSVSADNEGLLGSFGSASLESLQNADGWKELATALDKGLDMEPNIVLEARVALVLK